MPEHLLSWSLNQAGEIMLSGLLVHIGGLVVRTLDLRLLVVSSVASHDTAWLFLR